jgi:hypothetical protein
MTQTPQTLGALLEALQPQASDTQVSVRDIVTRIGARSFPAVILVPAVLLVSPLSGIPTTPTLAAIIVLMIGIQALIGRGHLWLPDVIMRRAVGRESMCKALNWLRKPAAWLDRYTRHGRLGVLTSAVMRWVTYGAVVALALSWPFLELLPFVTSFSAGAMALMMFGLMTRDGLYVAAGYAQAGVVYGALLLVWLGLF